MAKYLKLPVEVEAIQFREEEKNSDKLGEFVGGGIISFIAKDKKIYGGYIRSRGGFTEFRDSDWIIKYSPGEIWVSSDENFQKSYSEVK